MNAADRFQFFFDTVARKTTGCGNIIRAEITLEGIVAEKKLRDLIASNKEIQTLSRMYVQRKWHSTLYSFQIKTHVDIHSILHFYQDDAIEQKLVIELSSDCDLHKSSAVRIAVFYLSNETTKIIISVNHTLLDYVGMENLIASLSGNTAEVILEKKLKTEGSFYKKFADTVMATAYVAKRTSWNLRRLKTNTLQPKPCLEVVALSIEESKCVKQNLQSKIKSTALPFFIASSVFALRRYAALLTDKRGDFFIAVPLNRRPLSHQNVLIGNYLSFVYFHQMDTAIGDIKSLTASFNSQMIEQARKGMPQKFASLLQLFRFLPPIIYHWWMNLPTLGQSASFAFSLLPESALATKTFMGFRVKDVTHYPPVISPPGLNIVFTEFRERLKIIISFDENRMTKEQAQLFVSDIRKNLLN